MRNKTDDLRILDIKEVVSPAQLHEQLPITEAAQVTIVETRHDIHRILHQGGDRLLVIVGPCSIHDPEAAREYAGRLLALRKRLHQDLVIVMRVYFEKPRTTVGWKGLINDPDLDNSFHINKGLCTARELLLDLNNMGVPAGTEFLDLVTPQYVADLVSWGAIGARTTESQVHRELASGLSCPVGFKNGTDGTLRIAIDAIAAASRPHNFLSLTKAGHSAIFSTTGNNDCHLILRGGNAPNYDAENVSMASGQLIEAGLAAHVMVDCSHANSRKEFHRQIEVCRDIASQITAGDKRIIGVMLESHLVEGRQDVKDVKNLTYGQSITDACINWETTEALLNELAVAAAKRRKS